MDVSLDVVQTWISTIKSLTSHWDEIDFKSVSNILSIVNTIIYSSNEVSMQYDDLMNLHSVLSSTLNIIQSNNLLSNIKSNQYIAIYISKHHNVFASASFGRVPVH